MPWANVFDNVWLPLRLEGVSRGGARAAIEEVARQGRPRRLRQGLSARIVGRHEDARLDRPRAGDAAGDAADGRAVRRARRDHPHQAQRRSRRAQMRTRRDRRVRHPFGLRERLSLRPHRRHGAAARPGRRRDQGARAAAARRGIPPRRRLRRQLPRDFAAPCTTRWRWADRPGEPTERESGKIPAIRPAGAWLCSLRSVRWEAVVRINDIPPVILPSPSLIVATLVKDWPRCSARSRSRCRSLWRR